MDTPRVYRHGRSQLSTLFIMLYSFLLFSICFFAPARADFEDAQVVLDLSTANSTQSAPHWVVYADEYQSGVTGPPAASTIEVCTLDR